MQFASATHEKYFSIYGKINHWRKEMKNFNLKPAGIGLLLLAMLTATACKSNDDRNEPEPLTSAFELVYATYWGGSPQANKGNAISVDKDGYIYVAGETQAPSFYLKNPVIDTTNSTTGFVSKFAPDGQSVVYSTFLGDPQGYNFCVAMDVDDQGNAIAGGLAGGQGFPLKNPLYGTFGEPWQCGFLSSIAPQGSTLNFSTFILEQRVVALALDHEQGIYLATMDGTILKISADGSRLLYAYKIPGIAGDTWIEDMAVDDAGALVVAGWTSDFGFPSINPIPAVSGGLCDAFILKLNPAGNALEFATRLGGAEDDFANSVAVGSDGSIYVCGSTLSTDFPLKNAEDAAYGGNTDGFVARIDPANGILLYSTYLGGGGEDRATSMALNAAGEAYLSGWTTSPDFPVRGALRDHMGGFKDAFVTKLSANGDKILLSTYCGGSTSEPYININSDGFGADWSNDIFLGPEGKIYITGETYANDFPLLNPLDSSIFFSKAFIAVLREKQL
jgi:hypothetical protein